MNILDKPEGKEKTLVLFRAPNLVLSSLVSKACWISVTDLYIL